MIEFTGMDVVFLIGLIIVTTGVFILIMGRTK